MNELQTTQADRLKQLHGEIMGAARMVMEKAIEAGGILQDVKAALPHGAFTPWVETNAGFNIRTAQRYMKIYEHREELKNDSVSLLTDAHRMLTAPKEESLSDAEQKELERLEGIIETGLPKIRAMGLSLDDALSFAEHSDKYEDVHKRVLILRAEWESVKDSQDPKEVLAVYNKAKALHTEAAELTLDAEMHLGRCLNELKKLLTTKQEEEKFQRMCGILDRCIMDGASADDIRSAGGTEDHVSLFEDYKCAGLNYRWIVGTIQAL